MWHLRTWCSVRWILLQKSWNWSPLPLFSNQAVAYQPEALEALWHWRYVSQNLRGINCSLLPKKERKQEVGNPHLNKCCGKATSSPITRLSQTITPNPFSVATLPRARVRNFGRVSVERQVVGLYITTLSPSLLLIYHHHRRRDKLSPIST